MEPIQTMIEVLLIVSGAVVADSVVELMVRNFLSKAHNPVSGSQLIYGIIKVFVFGIGFLIALARLRISITPIVTALGVGGLAVALALQDTLANLSPVFIC